MSIKMIITIIEREEGKFDCHVRADGFCSRGEGEQADEIHNAITEHLKKKPGYSHWHVKNPNKH